MKIYGLKNCDTCRKAMRALPGFEMVDVRAQGVPPVVLKQAFKQFGGVLLNTRSTTWRGLDEAQRQQDPLDLIVQHPPLMKRPLIEIKGALFLSWNRDIEAGIKQKL